MNRQTIRTSSNLNTVTPRQSVWHSVYLSTEALCSDTPSTQKVSATVRIDEWIIMSNLTTAPSRPRPLQSRGLRLSILQPRRHHGQQVSSRKVIKYGRALLSCSCSRDVQRFHKFVKKLQRDLTVACSQALELERSDGFWRHINGAGACRKSTLLKVKTTFILIHIKHNTDMPATVGKTALMFLYIRLMLSFRVSFIAI